MKSHFQVRKQITIYYLILTQKRPENNGSGEPQLFIVFHKRHFLGRYKMQDLETRRKTTTTISSI